MSIFGKGGRCSSAQTHTRSWPQTQRCPRKAKENNKTMKFEQQVWGDFPLQSYEFWRELSLSNDSPLLPSLPPSLQPQPISPPSPVYVPPSSSISSTRWEVSRFSFCLDPFQRDNCRAGKIKKKKKVSRVCFVDVWMRVHSGVWRCAFL